MASIGINQVYTAQIQHSNGAQGACGACGASGAGGASETEKGNATDTFDKTEVKKEPYTYTVKNAKGEDETYNITIVNNKYYWSPGGVAVIDENKRYVELCIQQWANERRISPQKIEQQLKDEEAAKK